MLNLPTIDEAQVERDITRIIGNRNLAALQTEFNARFYTDHLCPVCGGPAEPACKEIWGRSLTARLCSPACIRLKEILYHGCCEKSRILNDDSAIAYHLSITCPIHGVQRFGTSD